jgi:hypothetical protein
MSEDWGHSLRQNNGHDKSIQTQGFSEDENQNHTHENLLLLGVGSHSCITDYSNSQSSCLYFENEFARRKFLPMMKDRNRVQMPSVDILVCQCTELLQ